MNINKFYSVIPHQENKSNNKVELEDFVFFSTYDRTFKRESLWNFKVKFGITSGDLELTEIYENDKFDLDGEENNSGFTNNGISYPPYNNTSRGRIIGYRKQEFSAEEGIIFSRRLKHVTHIHFLKIHVPNDIIESLENFNHTFLVVCDELSGFSRIDSTQNKNISFFLALTESTPNTCVYMSIAGISFAPPYNIKSLTFSIFNNTIDLSELDSAHVCESRINQHGYLEFILDTIPATFKQGHRICLPNDVELVSHALHDDMVVHDCVVIDGYIKDATVVFRDLHGKQMCRDTTNNAGTCRVSHKTNMYPLLAIAYDGIDTSTNNVNNMTLKTICLPSSAAIYMTPITTLVADYVTYLSKGCHHIQESIVHDTYETIENVLNIKNIESDYISTNNIPAGLRSYQIVCITKVCYELFKSTKKININHSIVMIKLAQALTHTSIQTSVFIDVTQVINLFYSIALASKIKICDTHYKQYCYEMAHIVVKYTSINTVTTDLSFELFANATKSLDEELRGHRKDPSLLRLLDMEYTTFELNIVCDTCTHPSIVKSIEEATTIIHDMFKKCLASQTNNIRQPIYIYERVLDDAYIIGKSKWNCRSIELNLDFANQYIHTSDFTLNKKKVHPFTIWILHDLFHILGFGTSTQWHENMLNDTYVGKMGLENYKYIVQTINGQSCGIPIHSYWLSHDCGIPNEIMTQTFSIHSSISQVTIGIFQDLGYEMNYESEWINNFIVADMPQPLIHYVVKENTCTACFGRLKCIKLENKRINTPLQDSHKYCTLYHVQVPETMENTIHVNIDIRKNIKIKGNLHVIPTLFVNNVIIDSLSRMALMDNETTIDFEFKDISRLIRETPHVTACVSVEFYFGSFYSARKTASCTFDILREFEWYDIGNVPLNFKPEIQFVPSLQSSHSGSLPPPPPPPPPVSDDSNTDSGVSISMSLDSQPWLHHIIAAHFHNNMAYMVSSYMLYKIDLLSLEIIYTLEMEDAIDVICDIDNNVYVACSNKIVFVDSSGTIFNNYTNSTITNVYSIDTKDNIIVLGSDSKLYILNFDVSDVRFVTSFYNDALKEYTNVCLNTSNSKIYATSKTQNTFVQINISNMSSLFVEGTFQSEHMLTPCYLEYSYTSDLLFVTCRVSKNIVIFDGTTNTPLVKRYVNILDQPVSTFYDSNENMLYVGSNTHLSKLNLYDTNDTFYTQNIPLSFDVKPNNFIYVDSSGVNVYSFTQDSIVAYSVSSLTQINSDTQHSLGVLVSDKEHTIRSINTDSDTHCILELDTYFPDLANVYLTSSKSNLFKIVNKDLQCMVSMLVQKTILDE